MAWQVAAVGNCSVIDDSRCLVRNASGGSDCSTECHTEESVGLSEPRAIFLHSEPNVLFALAPAISKCCGAKSVPASVAAAAAVLFSQADYISVQLVATPHILLSVQNLVQEGPTELDLLDCATSLAGLTVRSKSLLSTSCTNGRGCFLQDLEDACCLWDSKYHLCLPLFVPSDLSLLEKSLQVGSTQTTDTDSEAQRIVTEYATLAETSQCIGTMTLGTKDKAMFDNRHLSNLCLIALVSSLHLLLDTSDLLNYVVEYVEYASARQKEALPSELEHELEAEYMDEYLEAGFADDVMDELQESEADDLEGKESSSSGVACRAAFCGLKGADDDDAGSSSQSMLVTGSSGPSNTGMECSTLLLGDGFSAEKLKTEDVAEGSSGKHAAASGSGTDTIDAAQDPFTMEFQNTPMENIYVRWFSNSNIMSMRMSNLLTGFPWLIFSAYKHPWRLMEHAPNVAMIMLAYLCCMAYVLWRMPNLLRRYGEYITMFGFIVTSWYFPAVAGYIPIQQLTPEELSGLPWFPFMVGCLTNLIVPHFYKVRFTRYLPLQIVSIAIHARRIPMLCDRCCGGTTTCTVAAAAWVIAISGVISGLLVRFTEQMSRRSFLYSYIAGRVQ